jgi:hypothetical protein
MLPPGEQYKITQSDFYHRVHHMLYCSLYWLRGRIERALSSVGLQLQVVAKIIETFA